MTRCTTRLARALRWWASNDGLNIPHQHAAALRGLLEFDEPTQFYDLNARGKDAMRAHGYRDTDCGAWERHRDERKGHR